MAESPAKKWLYLALFFSFLFFLSSITFYYLPVIQGRFFDTPPPAEQPKIFVLTGLSCGLKENSYSEVGFHFRPPNNLNDQAPPYGIRNLVDEAKTEIIFQDTTGGDIRFDYEQIAENPLIEEVLQEQIGETLTIAIKRKGPFTPAEVVTEGSSIWLRLPPNDSYPTFSELEPKPDSVVFPSWQKISAQITTKAALEKSQVFFQGNQLTAEIKEISPNVYRLEFNEKLAPEQDYNVKIIASDINGKTSVQIWEFSAQRPLARMSTDSDRFKYLGWWGQINADVVPVMEEPTTQSKQLDTFSTIHRIKVLKEVSGESVNQNNLWLQIDGGKHPGAYIFSAYVDYIQQPEPPQNLTIPSDVKPGEYWIDTDLTKKVLTLYQYDTPVFATYVATGRPGNSTVIGTYRVWYKLLKTRMRGGPPVVASPYDLPNVPYVMYYYYGYGVHGTYWHDKFGTRQSSGCTNLTQGDAKYIFEKTTPVLPEGQNSTLSTETNPGVVINNHY